MILNKVKSINSLIAIILFVSLYIVGLYNYLLFHSIAEIFSICIATTIFAITWNSKDYIKSNYLVIIGVAYLFIGFLDLLHTLSYKGMSIFTDYDYYANQLWIATRFMESITLLISFIIIKYNTNLKTNLIFVICLTITVVIVLSIFYWKIFPVCFVEGVGQTKFKIISEYIISLILLLSLIFSYINRNRFDKSVYRYVAMSIVFTILSEMTFTFYVSNYGLLNMVGHYFKILSFYLIYKAIIENSIKEPQRIIFMELQSKVNTDGLTGLFNHRYLYEKLEAEIQYALITNIDFSIIIFDVDKFKNINDQFGHIIGDETLLGIGNTIQNTVRATDIVGRYGGEEFMVILPNTDIKSCYHIAEKIRKEIQNIDYCKNGTTITVSAGIAHFNASNSKKESHKLSVLASEFVNIADRNLYIAKSSGRNMTVGLE